MTILDQIEKAGWNVRANTYRRSVSGGYILPFEFRKGNTIVKGIFTPNTPYLAESALIDQFDRFLKNPERFDKTVFHYRIIFFLQNTKIEVCPFIHYTQPKTVCDAFECIMLNGSSTTLLEECEISINDIRSKAHCIFPQSFSGPFNSGSTTPFDFNRSVVLNQNCFHEDFINDLMACGYLEMIGNTLNTSFDKNRMWLDGDAVQRAIFDYFKTHKEGYPLVVEPSEENIVLNEWKYTRRVHHFGEPEKTTLWFKKNNASLALTMGDRISGFSSSLDLQEALEKASWVDFRIHIPLSENRIIDLEGHEAGSGMFPVCDGSPVDYFLLNTGNRLSFSTYFSDFNIFTISSTSHYYCHGNHEVCNGVLRGRFEWHQTLSSAFEQVFDFNQMTFDEKIFNELMKMG